MRLPACVAPQGVIHDEHGLVRQEVPEPGAVDLQEGAGEAVEAEEAYVRVRMCGMRGAWWIMGDTSLDKGMGTHRGRHQLCLPDAAAVR